MALNVLLMYVADGWNVYWCFVEGTYVCTGCGYWVDWGGLVLWLVWLQLHTFQVGIHL